MGVVSYEHEAVTTLPPAKLFKAFVIDADNLLPKVLPGAYKSVETLQGDGGAGTIKLIHFGEKSPFKFAKHRVDEVDETNFGYKYSLIDGDVLGDELESISCAVKVVPGADGGSVVTTTSSYHTKTDNHSITEEKIKEGKQKAQGVFHALEAYLNANPHEYN